VKSADSSLVDPWASYCKELGANLGKFRHARELSQEKLAHLAGISTFTYRKLEYGESNPGTSSNPRLKTLLAIAEVLDCSLQDILPATVPKTTSTTL